MQTSLSDNRRIAKNTIVLYLRMIVTMSIALFTSREVLRILGVEDFGIYNLVAGFIVLFSFLQTGLVSSSQRFLAYDIGKNDNIQIHKTFCVSFNANICIAIFVFLLSETVGLWFVKTKLVIPEARMNVALAVYQFSIGTFIVNILRTTYNSVVIAYEKMTFYAYVSILETVLKLVVVYLLILNPFDKLWSYAFFLLLISIIVYVIYYWYSRRTFSFCHYEPMWEGNYFKELLSFSGWSMLGGFANVSAIQGGNVLLNNFSGLIANASYGIAGQVSHAIYSFSQSFQMAFSPQITKLYAVSDYNNLYKLVFRSSLFSYYLMLILAIPFIMKADFVLSLWLNEVPDYAAGFCIWMTIFQLVDAFQAPLNTLICSTGKIKIYYIWLSTLIFLNIPLSFWLLEFGFSAYVVLIIRAGLNIVTAVIRIFYMKNLMTFPVKDYLKKVVMRSLFVTSSVSIIALLLVPLFKANLFGNIVYILTIVIITLSIVTMFGVSSADRKVAINYFYNRLQKKG